MKKIINGRMYNTDTAELVGKWDNCLSRTDFGYCEEKLYRKKTGEYFLHGKGGARSRWCEWVGNCVCDGEGIIPLNITMAKEWAENNLSADEYEEIFGEVEE
jgi:hypothetical protein